MKRTDLLGIAILLVPLGGCALAPLSNIGSSAASAKTAPKPDAKQPAALPTDLASAILSAQTARKSGDFGAAAKTLSQLVLIAPDDARVLGEYGKTLAGQGRSDDALAFLERASQLEPNDWSLFSAEGVALDQKGNYQAAQTFYARALSLKPGEPSVLNNDALSHMQAGDLDGAETLLRQATPGSADDPRIAQNLALVQSLKAAQPAKAVASAVPAPAPTQVASVTPPAPVTPAAIVTPSAEPIAAPLAKPTPVIAATLETPPAVPAPKTEPRSIDTLKTDPTVRMQAVPKDAQAGAAQRELPAKADAASLVAPKVAQAPAPVKPAIATAPALMSKSATTATPAPKLITAAARTPSSSSAFYVQAGSYPTEARAGQAATALDSMGAHVMSGTADGHAVYRVRIGPFLNIRQANAAVEQAHALGHADLVIVTE